MPNVKVAVTRHHRVGRYFREELGEGATLSMVFVPEGEFMMGAPATELESLDSERPQHLVRVPQFFMANTPITQAQWKAVAALPQEERELNPEPSRFTGENLPVERVSWYDAVEFCQRLSKATKREYRLPSEAEWEYACRAGTETPFHFGETITTELANYRGTDYEQYKLSGSYGRGPKGEYREQTTAVGNFPANAFGLYDLHGNVWEWCLDDWHKNYEGAPVDGSAWLEQYDSKTKSLSSDLSKVLRGGSWDYYPRYCRSAYRDRDVPAIVINNDIGFRVVCVSPRTL